MSKYRTRIRSRHPSHAPLRVRGVFPLFKKRSVIRFGSLTEYDDSVTNGGSRLEINTVQAVKNSSSKIKMKQCFVENDVKTATWWKFDSDAILFLPEGNQNKVGIQLSDLPFPIISKSEFGSRNKGNKKHDTSEELSTWLASKSSIQNYIFEKYYNFSREYRLHISKNGCFYSCRKMLKRDTEDKDKWYRNDTHCVWILEENENFDKPTNWDAIVAESVKALQAVGLDIGAVDLRIQSATDSSGNTRQNPEFIIVEINSAPSFGTITIEKYKTELTRLILQKHE